MNQDNDQPKKNGSANRFIVNTVTLLVAIPVGGALLSVAESIFPGIKERWNLMGPFIALVCAGCVFGCLAIFVSYTRLRHSGSMSTWLFIGLLAPWWFHFIFAFLEFIQGGGI